MNVHRSRPHNLDVHRKQLSSSSTAHFHIGIDHAGNDGLNTNILRITPQSINNYLVNL